MVAIGNMKCSNKHIYILLCFLLISSFLLVQVHTLEEEIPQLREEYPDNTDFKPSNPISISDFEKINILENELRSVKDKSKNHDVRSSEIVGDVGIANLNDYNIMNEKNKDEMHTFGNTEQAKEVAKIPQSFGNMTISFYYPFNFQKSYVNSILFNPITRQLYVIVCDSTGDPGKVIYLFNQYKNDRDGRYRFAFRVKITMYTLGMIVVKKPIDELNIAAGQVISLRHDTVDYWLDIITPSTFNYQSFKLDDYDVLIRAYCPSPFYKYNSVSVSYDQEESKLYILISRNMPVKACGIRIDFKGGNKSTNTTSSSPSVRAFDLTDILCPTSDCFLILKMTHDSKHLFVQSSFVGYQHQVILNTDDFYQYKFIKYPYQVQNTLHDLFSRSTSDKYKKKDGMFGLSFSVDPLHQNRNTLQFLNSTMTSCSSHVVNEQFTAEIMAKDSKDDTFLLGLTYDDYARRENGFIKLIHSKRNFQEGNTSCEFEFQCDGLLILKHKKRNLGKPLRMISELDEQNRLFFLVTYYEPPNLDDLLKYYIVQVSY